jgi:hypothetical protein
MHDDGIDRMRDLADTEDSSFARNGEQAILVLVRRTGIQKEQ